MKRGPNYPLGCFDATEWAREFCRRYGTDVIDEALMISWFANAIMTGYDRGREDQSLNIDADREMGIDPLAGDDVGAK